jgi:RNA recognition motif-containing protein
MDKNTGKSKGYGFVTFQDTESANKVKQSNNLYFLGKMMNVGDAVRKSDSNQNITRSNNYIQTGGYNPYLAQQSYYQQQQQQFFNPQFNPYLPQFFNYGQPLFDQTTFQQGWQPIPPPTTYQAPPQYQPSQFSSQQFQQPTYQPMTQHSAQSNIPQPLTNLSKVQPEQQP